MNSEATHFELTGVKNIRDVGGVPTTSGAHFRRGLLFRSAQLDATEPEKLDRLADLGIETVFDLRTTREVENLPDKVPSQVEVVHLDVLAGTDASVVSHLEDLFDRPLEAAELLKSGQVKEHYLGTYRSFVSLQSALDAYSSLFGRLAGGEQVSLFHCTAGKDRTGWAAASLQLLLGVPRTVVDAEYLSSNGPVLELFSPVLDRFAEAGGDPDLLRPVFGVEIGYLDAALDEAESDFGSIEGYFREGLSLGSDGVDALRARFVGEGSDEG